MFQPARMKRAMVASCRLPLGMPSLSLLATELLFLAIDFCVGRKRDWPRKATDGTLVTHQAVSFNLNAKQQRIVVAVRRRGNNAQAVTAGFALHPQLLARTAPESDEPGFQRFGVADGVEKAQHKHLAGGRILNDSRQQAVHFFKVNLRCVFAHFHPDSDLDLVRAAKSPPALFAGGLASFRSLWPFRSGHGSPPAWESHDGGDDRDCGGFASD